MSSVITNDDDNNTINVTFTNCTATRIQEKLRRLNTAETKEECLEAIAGIRLLAESINCPEAQLRLGLIYYYGDSVPTNYEESNKWFFRAAQQGNARAQNAIANSLMDGEGIEKNEKLALKWYEKSAAQGYSRGLISLASCYFHGQLGLLRDEKRALELFEKAKIAAIENPEEEEVVGGYLYRGELGTPDREEAIKWWTKAANRGCASACFSIGNHYRTNGTEDDRVSGMHGLWYEKAAKAGYVNGMRNFAFYLLEKYPEEKGEEILYWWKRGTIRGDTSCAYNLAFYYDPSTEKKISSIEKNIDIALNYYRISEEFGDVDACLELAYYYFNKKPKDAFDCKLCVDFSHKYIRMMNSIDRTDPVVEYCLGMCYFWGANGVEKNYEAAIKWMTLSAERDCKEAQHTLADWYYSGINGYLEQDYKIAVQLWQKAALKNELSESYVKLALMYWSGLGVERNEEKTIELLEKAEELGDNDASYNLGCIYSPYIDIFDEVDSSKFSNSRKSIDHFKKAISFGSKSSYYYRLAIEIDHLVEHNDALDEKERASLEQESVKWIMKYIKHAKEIDGIGETSYSKWFASNGLPRHPNITPLDRMYYNTPLTLSQILEMEERKLSLQEVIHIGKRLCDVLNFCQENGRVILRSDPENIHIFLPRVYQIRRMYGNEMKKLPVFNDNFPRELITLILEYQVKGDIISDNIIANFLLQSRLVFNDFEMSVNEWSLSVGNNPASVYYRDYTCRDIAPEVCSKNTVCTKFANAHTLGCLLLLLSACCVEKDEKLSDLITGLLEYDVNERTTLDEAKKYFYCTHT